MFYIGLILGGTIHAYKGQGIKTQFILLGVPLIPIKSFYVIQEDGKKNKRDISIPINLHRKSIRYGYAKSTLLLIGIGLLIGYWPGGAGATYRSNTENIIYFSISLLLIINGIFHRIKSESISQDEKKVRDILNKGCGYNILPQYLSVDDQKNIFTEILKKFSIEQPQADRKKIITDKTMNSQNSHILYALSYYMFHISKQAEDNAETSSANIIDQLEKTNIDTSNNHKHYELLFHNMNQYMNNYQ